MNYRVLVTESFPEYLKNDLAGAVYFDFYDEEEAISFLSEVVAYGKDASIYKIL